MWPEIKSLIRASVDPEEAISSLNLSILFCNWELKTLLNKAVLRLKRWSYV